MPIPEPADTPPAGSRGARLAAGIVLLCALVLHVRLVASFVHPASLGDGEPFYRVDYAMVYAYGIEATHYLGRGAVWGYNPFLLAGFPSLGRAGHNYLPLVLRLARPLDPARTFKLFVLATFLVAPLLPLVAALLLRPPSAGSPPRTALPLGSAAAQSALVLLLSVAYWQLDRFTYLFRWYGGFSFLFASFAAPAALAAAVRFLDRPDLGRAIVAGVGCGLLLSLHATAFVPVAGGIAAGAIAAGLRPGGLARLRLAGLGLVAAAIGIAPNLLWLLPFVRFGHYLEEHAVFGQTERVSLAADIWLSPGRGLLVLLAALAVPGLLATGRQGRRVEATAFAAAIGCALALSLWGSSLGLAYLEPFRLLIPLGTLAILPAARGIAWIAKAPRRHALAAVAIAAVSATPFLLRPGYRPFERDWLTGYLNTRERETASRLVGWLREHTDRSARVAFEEALFPASSVFSCHMVHLLQLRSEREFLNAPYNYLPMVHRRVQFAGGRLAERELAGLGSEELASLLSLYNVGWLVATADATRARLDRDPALLARVADIDGLAIYEVRLRRTFFLEGEGEVDATYDEIRVRGASPGRIVLKYHWFEALATEPPLPLLREPAGDDPVGFIRVDNGATRDFRIVNRG